jgi:TonB family protein
MRHKQSSSPWIPVVTLSLMLGVTTLLSPVFAAAPPAKRPEAQQEFWARYDKKDWSAAIAEARRMAEQARADAKAQPLALANALTLLGNAQLSSGDKAGAEPSYREALQITEMHFGAASANMLDPLRGLGYTLALLERHQEAIPYLERSLVIGRRSFGLFDMAQQGVLRQLAASLTQTGKVIDAEKHMLYLQRIGERTYGESDPRMSPLLCIIGDWYVDTGNFMLGRDRYRLALQIVERKLGKNDAALVEPLRSTARSYMQEIFFFTQGFQPLQERTPLDFQGNGEPKGVNPKYLNNDGEKALERALAILDARPDTTPLLLGDTLIQLGDWHQLKHQPDKALVYYRRAATVVASMTTTDAAAAPLSFPVRIYYPLPPLAMRNRQLTPEQTEEKFVAVQFTVTGSGDVQDAKVIEQNGTTRQASEALQAIRASRFRPKFVNGEPVETEGLINREVFKTRKQPSEDGKDS